MNSRGGNWNLPDAGLSRDAEYWEQRFAAGNTPWELHGPSCVLIESLKGVVGDELDLRGLTILVPGCGTGADAMELASRGASVVAVDWAQYACDQLNSRLAGHDLKDSLGSVRVVHGDFFSVAHEPVDIVVEHTFFCAIDPSRRPEYVSAILRWLKPGGYLVGNFFVLSEQEARELPGLSLTKEGSGPPFATTESELAGLFAQHFTTICLQQAKVAAQGRRPGMEWSGSFRLVE